MGLALDGGFGVEFELDFWQRIGLILRFEFEFWLTFEFEFDFWQRIGLIQGSGVII